MKLFRLFICCILFSTCYLTFAQTQIQNLHAEIIKIDPYGNIYAVKEAQISKFSLQGKLLFTFSNPKLGTISSIDVFNPMKIMLFYQNAGMILFLNEQLSPIKEPVSLLDAGFYNISLASYSAANQIHLYDNASKYLTTLDFFMREISKTPLYFNAFNPVKMIELEEKSLAIHDPETGVYLFDSFGTFNKLIRVVTECPITVTPELIFYTHNNELFLYNYKTLTSETQQLPVSNVVQALIYRNHRVLLLQDGTVWIY